MTASFIIPTCNRPGELKRLLSSIAEQTLPPNEIVIVDQSDGDASKAVALSFEQELKRLGTKLIWFTQKERSLTKARNKGVCLSAGDIVLFADDDCVLEKDYIHSIMAYFKRYPDLGGISGSLSAAENPSGWKWGLRKILMRVFLLDMLNGRLTASGFGYPIFRRGIDKLTYVELLPGCSMSFRRNLLEENPSDEHFTSYGFREDVELCYRISRKVPLAMIPEARYQHLHSSVNRNNGALLSRMKFRNYYYVFKKHKARSFLSAFLFVYSATGILFIDFFEWVTSFREDKWRSLTHDIAAAYLMKRDA